jgi:hypothetical protein
MARRTDPLGGTLIAADRRSVTRWGVPVEELRLADVIDRVWQRRRQRRRDEM